MADESTGSGTILPFERRNVEGNNLSEMLMMERILNLHGRSIAKTYLPCLRAIDDSAPISVKDALKASHQKSLRDMIERSVPEQTLNLIAERLDLELSCPSDESAVELCLAGLIDSRVKLPHNLPVFLEAAVFDLVDLKFPPCVVAAACERIRRERSYFPEISEIIAACQQTLERYRDQRRQVTQALLDRQQAERWLSQLATT